MNVTFAALFAGERHGTKDDKDWCRVTLDDPLDPVDRMEVFVQDKTIIKYVGQLSPGSLVNCRARLYKNQKGFLNASLEDISAGN